MWLNGWKRQHIHWQRNRTVSYTHLIDGEITSIPFEKAGAVFYYIKEVFEKAGITEFPKTWDELLEACKKIKDSGVTPISLYTADDAWYTCNLFTYLAAGYAGVDALNKGGDINTEQMKAAAAKLRCV